jgi:hypothetical protein
MSSDPRDPTDLGTSLRRALSERVSTVHAEPDFGDLKRRIDRAAYGSQRRGRLSLAAAALVVAAVVGGSLGAFLAPIRAQHGILSSSAKNQGGSLPTGPGRSAPSKHGLRASGPTNPGTEGQESPLDIKRATAAGTQLTTDGTWLSPVGVASGTSLNDCFAAELLTTTAAKGTAVATSTGVVALQPLAPDGLEVVDSGAMPVSDTVDLWWATIAVGSNVARVAAEEPDGTTDAMRPVADVAVLGGTTAASVTSRFFSVVAEDGSGQSLHSIGFLMGWGPEAIGTSTGQTSSIAPSGTCLTSGSADQTQTTSGSQPAAPLLATQSVVSAFHQAYTFDASSGVATNLAAVESGASLDSSVGQSSSHRTIGSAGSSSAKELQTPSTVATEVKVATVTFLSAREAEVIYQAGNGRWRTGIAVIASSGIWEVSRHTFCGDVLSGLPATSGIPAAVVTTCQRLSVSG